MQQTVACPNCGLQNAASQQFCVSCGAHLGGSARQAIHTPIVTGVVTPQPVLSQSPPAAHVQTRQIDVKPTWGLAWGLFWRMLCLLLFTGGAAFLIYMLVRMVLGYTSVFGSF